MNKAPTEPRGGTAPVHVAPLTDDAATAICTLARSLGFDCTRIDLAGCSDKAEFLARIAAALGFPAWFGHNWDAFFDCLTDLSWRPALGYVLILERAAELQATEPEVFDTGLAILGDAATVWQARGAPFRVFVSITSASTGA
jgi:RNAse (barnase) inhibitor barstar